MYPERADEVSCGRRSFGAGLVAVVLAACVAGPAATAVSQEAPFPQELTLTPESDTAVAGTCNAFTARLTGFSESPDGGLPIAGATVDVLQTLSSPGLEPDEVRELSFCNPSGDGGPNPTGGGGASFGDASGNNPGATAGQPGRHTSLHGEVGPTDQNGEVTFGISMTPATSAGSVTVTAWHDFDGDDLLAVEAERSDVSTKTWRAQTKPKPTVAATIDAAPEAVTNANGTQHRVTVTVFGDGEALEGIVPRSVIVAHGAGRPAGDVANEASGPSPNFGAAANPYACSASDSGGLSTCTFQDPLGSGPGTDTVVFFVGAGGAEGRPDPGDPQDAVQVAWTEGPPDPPPGGGGGGSGPNPARNIVLCFGEVGLGRCETAPQTLAAGDLEVVRALVTDGAGAPVAGVPVELRGTGPGHFLPGGADSAVVTTASNGTAAAEVTSDEGGIAQIEAEIGPPHVPGGFRAPGPLDDVCEQPGGPGGNPPAGNCVAGPLTITWIGDFPECADDTDNDGDTYVDEEDPSCESPDDASESPQDHADVRVLRRANLHFDHDGGDLLIYGYVHAVEGELPAACAGGQTVLVQERVEGRWRTKARVTTSPRGRYETLVEDDTGRYRAVVLRSEAFEPPVAYVCARTRKGKPHRHR